MLAHCTMTSQAGRALRLDKPLPRVVEDDSISEDGSQTSEVADSGEENPKTWKPVTQRAPLLLTLFTVTICLIVVLQLLSSKSQRDGGILFAPTTRDFSAGQTFVYLYLPVVITVLYGIIWAWVDLDVKRLEPFYRMSSPEGALPKDSIFLNYPFEFLTDVLLKALKRRHWAVLTAGLAAMLASLAVTPMTGAIFGVTSTIVNATVPISRGAFLAPSDQVRVLNGNIFNDAYTMIWLGIPVPKYTRRDLVLHPYFLAKNTNTSKGELTAPTYAYFTNLTCSPAIVDSSVDEETTYSNGKGCSIQLPSAGVGSLSLMYDGWFPCGQRLGSLSEGHCPEMFNNTFLAIWTDLSKETSSFCEAHYYAQEVNATLSLPSLAVMDVVATGPEEEMNPDSFNTTNFHYLLGNAVAALSESDTGQDGSFGCYGADLPDRTILDLSTKLGSFGVSTSLDISEYVFGPGMPPIEEFQNSTVLEQRYQSVHQLLFSAAMSRVMILNSSNGTLQEGQHRISLAAVQVDKTFTIIAQAVLGIISFLTLLLILLNSQRHLNLSSDPGSIQSLMEICSRSQKLVKHVDSLRVKSDQPGGEQVSEIRLRLVHTGSTTSKFEMTKGSSLEMEQSTNANENNVMDSQQLYRPLEMRIPVGTLWISFHVGLIVTIVVLYAQIRKANGLELPSSDRFVKRLLLNYLPIAVSKLLEPFWVLLNRTRAAQQPFHELSKQNARARVSTQTRHTSLPPQMIIWRALKSKHFILASICFVTILGEVLSVGLSELFQTLPTTRTRVEEFEYTLQSTFSNTYGASNYSNNDYLYTLRDKLANNGTLPPWVGEEFMFMPFQTSQSSQALHGTVGTEQEAVTRGFGFEMTCFNNTVKYAQKSFKDWSFSIQFKGKSGHPYPFNDSTHSDAIGTFTVAELPYYPAAVEWGSGNVDGSNCPGCLAVGWLRNNVYFNQSQAMFLGCQSALRTANFSVRVDHESKVISSVRTTDFEYDLHPYFGDSSHLDDIISNILFDFWDVYFDPYWHNLTFAGDWMNYLIKISDSDAVVNPLEPVPTYEHIAPVIQHIYNQYFAIKLGMNLQWFKNNSVPARDKVQGSITWVEDGVFFAPTLSLLTVIILSIDLVVAVLVYSSRLPDMIQEAPTSLASIIKMVGFSFACADTEPGQSDGGEMLYGYGSFIGTDGKPHVGIERSHLVVPITKPQSKLRRFKWCCW